MKGRDNYIPSGDLQGKNTGALPDCGCHTGFLGTSHGVDISQDATNKLSGAGNPGDQFNGRISGAGTGE
jgi:hypothetical protein